MRVKPESGGTDPAPLTLQPLPSSVAAARTYVRQVLLGWGYADLADPAELGVSELVTNAAIHARTDVTVRVRRLGDGAVRIEVADGSAVLPSPRDYGVTSSVGRGLRLLKALGEWGCDPATDLTGRRKVVWFVPGTEVDETAFSPDLSVWDLGEAAPAEPDPDVGTRATLGRYSPPATGDLVTVRMLRFPLRLFAEARQHHDELVREFSLLALAPPGTSSRPLPHRLVELIETLGGRYRAAAERADAVRDAALARGELSIDLTYQVPSSARDAMIALAGLMDEADQFCRDEQLLTLAESPLQQQFRRWFTEQFVHQIVGGPATAWPGPLVAGDGEG